MQCADGSYPDEARITCLPCPTGFAGVNGFCNIDCVAGTQPNANRTLCVACSEGSYSPTGDQCDECQGPGLFTSDRVQCSACDDGTMPSSARSGCEPCPEGMAGTGGICEQCPLGTQPRIDPESRAVLADECVACTNTEYFNRSSTM